MKCPEDAVGEEIKNAIEKDQEIIVRNHLFDKRLLVKWVELVKAY